MYREVALSRATVSANLSLAVLLITWLLYLYNERFRANKICLIIIIIINERHSNIIVNRSTSRLQIALIDPEWPLKCIFSKTLYSARQATFCDPFFVIKAFSVFFFSVLWHCWLGNKKGIRPVKSWMLVCWWWWIDWSFACLVAVVVTTTSVIPSSNKM